ncbi:MAG TPA: PQQ-binding-like beta-propeller repeat protein [Bryobacteraceae bacterium]|nr:PQQ-binding-like beta-propeller repeat protein [Bryobacteraceae bacterium]
MGHDLDNTRSQPAETQIGPTNVGSLSPNWTFTAGGDISVTPTVSGNAVYFPDWAGNLYAVDKNAGKLLWKHLISDYDGVPGSVARVSPAVNGNDLIFGDVLSTRATHNGANMMAVDRQTGALHWITKVDTNPAAVITGSAVVFNGTVYVGVSSIEETLAQNNNYPCCTFRGSIVALDANTGAIRWKTFVVPDNGGVPGGYTGGAVWQPPAIDPSRGSLFIGTGNNYSVPASVMACMQQNPNAACVDPNDLFDTALSLDLATGKVKWARKFQTFDVWTLACISAPPRDELSGPEQP